MFLKVAINNGGHVCGLLGIIEGVFLSLNDKSILNVRIIVQAYKNTVPVPVSSNYLEGKKRIKNKQLQVNFSPVSAWIRNMDHMTGGQNEIL